MSDGAKKVDERLRTDGIVARLKAASPGKWKTGSHVDRYKVTAGKQNICSCYGSEADVEFIANAPADIEWLLQHVLDLQEETQDMREDREG